MEVVDLIILLTRWAQKPAISRVTTPFVGVATLLIYKAIIGVITPFTTSRGPPCRRYCN